jgi:hypothetical protein
VPAKENVASCWIASVPYVSVRGSCNISGDSSRVLETVVFHLPCCWSASPGPPGEVIPPGTNGRFDLEEGLVLLASQGEGLGCTTKPSEVQESVRGVPPVKLVRTRVQILGLPLSGRRGAWAPPRVTRVTLSNSETMTSRCWEWGGTLGCLHMNVYEWDVAWLWSKCGAPICGSVANSYGLGWALTEPLVQGLYRSLC